MITNREFVSLYCGWGGKGKKYGLLSLEGSTGHVYIDRTVTIYLPFNTIKGPIKFIKLQEAK